AAVGENVDTVRGAIEAAAKMAVAPGLLPALDGVLTLAGWDKANPNLAPMAGQVGPSDGPPSATAAIAASSGLPRQVVPGPSASAEPPGASIPPPVPAQPAPVTAPPLTA